MFGDRRSLPRWLVCIIQQNSLKMKKLFLSGIAALALFGCSTDAALDRPGLNNEDSDLGSENQDAYIEDIRGDKDLGDDITVDVPDATGEKPCVSLTGCLLYQGVSNDSSPSRDYFLEIHPQIMNDYRAFIERGILDIAYHGLVNSGAELASECARNQGESEFFRYLTYLFEHQDEWAHATSTEIFKEIAQSLVENPSYGRELYGEVRLSLEDFEGCVDRQETREAVWDGINECVERMKITEVVGAPTIFINEQVVRGAKSYEVFAGAIDNELEKCREHSNHNI